MPIFIRLRLAAMRLARALRRSILEDTKQWEIDADRQGRACLTAGPFQIVVAPRAVRLFDALYVYCGGAEVWLPLWSRLRLRNAVRLVLAENAIEMLESSRLETTSKRTRTTRRRTREEQPA
jgi:hypothetical protein